MISIKKLFGHSEPEPAEESVAPMLKKPLPVGEISEIRFIFCSVFSRIANEKFTPEQHFKKVVSEIYENNISPWESWEELKTQYFRILATIPK